MILDHLDVSVTLACRRFSWDSGRTRRDDDIGVGMTRRHGLVDGISINRHHLRSRRQPARSPDQGGPEIISILKVMATSNRSARKTPVFLYTRDPTLRDPPPLKPTETRKFAPPVVTLCPPMLEIRALRHFMRVPCQGALFSPVGIRAGKLSLQPEAFGAGQEATNGLKHFEKRPCRGSADRAGRNVSKHRAGLERRNVGADPPLERGRPPSSVKRARHATDDPAGVVMAARTGHEWCATREVCDRGMEMAPPRQWRTREGQRQRPQMADGFVVPMRPGNAGGGKEP